VRNRADLRKTIAGNWAEQMLGGSCVIRPLAGDASFRRYFRISHRTKNFVLMDAPPEHEDVRPFLKVRAWLERVGVRVPHLVAVDESRGLLLLEDFGDITWAVHLRENPDPAPLLDDALRQLTCLQSHASDFELPVFDAGRMKAECSLYLDWYLPHVAAHKPSVQERQAFHAALAPILEKLAALPRTPVHLDYHSRNLMLPQGRLPLGVIDFQDAVTGPVTYDLASLLYDCYQAYPEAVRRNWSRRFFASLPAMQRRSFSGFDDWHHGLRLTALQRHIKAIGIFTRLAYRDGKKQFLDEIPLTLGHLREEMGALGLAETRHPLLFLAPA